MDAYRCIRVERGQESFLTQNKIYYGAVAISPIEFAGDKYIEVLGDDGFKSYVPKIQFVKVTGDSITVW